MANRVRTISAPNASALNMSVPVVKPPSTKTSQRPLTAAPISGRASICLRKTVHIQYARMKWTSTKRPILHVLGEQGLCYSPVAPITRLNAH